MLLILILTHEAVILAVIAASMLLTLMVLRMVFQRSLTDLEPLYLTLFIINVVSFIHKKILFLFSLYVNSLIKEILTLIYNFIVLFKPGNLI